MATQRKPAPEAPKPVFADDEAVSGAELAQVLGLSERRIRQLAEAEMFQRLAPNLYSLRASARAYVEYLRVQNLEAGRGESAELEADRGRLVKARADAAEMDLAAKRGELVSIEDVGAAWGEIISVIRAGVLGLPTKLAPFVADETDPARCCQILEAEVHRILQALADHPVYGPQGT